MTRTKKLAQAKIDVDEHLTGLSKFYVFFFFKLNAPTNIEVPPWYDQ